MEPMKTKTLVHQESQVRATGNSWRQGLGQTGTVPGGLWTMLEPEGRRGPVEPEGSRVKG